MIGCSTYCQPIRRLNTTLVLLTNSSYLPNILLNLIACAWHSCSFYTRASFELFLFSISVHFPTLASFIFILLYLFQPLTFSYIWRLLIWWLLPCLYIHFGTSTFLHLLQVSFNMFVPSGSFQSQVKRTFTFILPVMHPIPS